MVMLDLPSLTLQLLTTLDGFALLSLWQYLVLWNVTSRVIISLSSFFRGCLGFLSVLFFQPFSYSRRHVSLPVITNLFTCPYVTGEGTGCDVTAAMAGCVVICVVPLGSDIAPGMALWVGWGVTADRALWVGWGVTAGMENYGCGVTGRKNWESLNARSTPLRLVVIGTCLAQLQHGGWWQSSRAFFPCSWTQLSIMEWSNSLASRMLSRSTSPELYSFV